MSWLALTFISVSFRSIYGVLTKVLSNVVKTSVYTQAVLLPLSAGFVALILSPFFGGLTYSAESISWAAVLLVVFGQGLGNIVYFAAIKRLTNSTGQIAFSSILVFNTLLSVMFFGLELSLLNIVGVVLLMFAILSVTSGKITFDSRGVLLMMFAALLFAIFQLSSSVLSSQVSAALYLVVAYFGAASVAFVLKHRQVISDLRSVTDYKITFGIPVITALPSIGNFLFAYYAYKVAPEPTKVAILLTSQVVFTVILSYIFLRERDHVWRKVFAAILVVVSAALIRL